MENSFGSLIGASTSILILLPQKPSFDAVAAGLSLYLGLRADKDVSIVSPDPMVVEFNRLVGVNKVAAELGNKNLTIKFTDYKATDIERVSYDIENSEFRLTVIPKPGFPSPKKEQVAFSYSGVAAETIILVGGTSDADFPFLSSPDLTAAKILHVGTRALNPAGTKTILSFARPASSLSELIASLMKESSFALDADIATNLLAGIWDGSRELKGEDVTAETFEMIATLMRTGARLMPKENLASFPAGSVPGIVPEEEKPDAAPKDWLEPKIYKGTSIS